MARLKKQDLTINKPTLPETVSLFIDRCFKDGEIACISPKFDETYQLNGVDYIFTEEVLEEMLRTGQVRATWRSDKLVNLMGIKTL